MLQFLAIVKMLPNDTATRIMFGAEGYAEAVKSMCQFTGCDNTGGLYEYDLLEVVTGGYRVVAQKQGGHAVSPPFREAPPKEMTEGTYTPYSVMRPH